MLSFYMDQKHSFIQFQSSYQKWSLMGSWGLHEWCEYLIKLLIYYVYYIIIMLILCLLHFILMKNKNDVFISKWRRKSMLNIHWSLAYSLSPSLLFFTRPCMSCDWLYRLCLVLRQTYCPKGQPSNEPCRSRSLQSLHDPLLLSASLRCALLLAQSWPQAPGPHGHTWSPLWRFTLTSPEKKGFSLSGHVPPPTNVL